MDDQVLVTYATKYGATAEIAEKIGLVFRQSDLPTDVLRVDDVRDLTLYRAVVLGSAVYIGRWRKEAVKFLKNNEKVLAERPVWLFSSGPTGEGDPEELLNGWRYPGKIQPFVDSIQPRDIALFHGTVDTEKLSFIKRSMIKNVAAPVGDFRDWESIIAWAAAVVDELKQPTV